MSYFQDVNYRGETYSLKHLEPFTLSLESKRSKRTLKIRVIYTNHCFSKGLERNKEDFCVGDPVFDRETTRPRIFCSERYDLSLRLEGVIRSLIGRKVRQTASERNWCYVTEVQLDDGDYHVFFELKKASDEKKRMQDLELRVESAYLLREANFLGSMLFDLLCSKVYQNEKTRTKR